MIDVDNCDAYGLTARQAEMVNLVERRFNRAAIAAHLGISTQTVRDVLGGMCDYYDCPGYLLPDKIRERAAKENLSDGR